MHSIAEKDVAHDFRSPAELRLMNNGLAAHEHPVIAVQPFNADAGLIGCHHIGAAQILDNFGLLGCKWHMRTPQHFGERPLAQGNPEQIGQHPFQPHKRHRLKRLQIKHQRVQPRTKG
jgi:hypothetical protein